MTMFHRLLIVAILGAMGSAHVARYDNYQVFRVMPETEEQLDALRAIQESPSNGLIFWSEVLRVGVHADIMVPPHKIPEFQEIMSRLQLNHKRTIENVQRLIDNERPKVQPRAVFDWTNYHRLAEVNAWLDSLVASYPNVVSSIVGGSSYEGREIRGAKVSYKDGNPGIFVECGIHANEWITVATTTFVLNELLTSNDTRVRNIAENFDWYIFPSVNPDGYEYTHTTDRQWRKTRSPGEVCYGADPNRNWGYHWGENTTATDPCSNMYPGKSAFSETETRTLSAYITSLASKLQVYLDFHAFGQLLMIPYGLTYDVVDNYDNLMEIGNDAVDALATRYGTVYKMGPIYSTIYYASGSSIDWVRKNLDIPYTFVWELRDTGEYGMLLPAEQIIPTAQETLDSVVALLEDVQKLESNKRIVAN